MDTAVMYKDLKASIRRAEKDIKEDEIGHKLGLLEGPVIIVDFYAQETKYFISERDAHSYLEDTYADQWDDEPPEGEDEELVVIKYCTQYHKDKWPGIHRDYKFYKEVDGIKIYREKKYPYFEPELKVSVSI